MTTAVRPLGPLPSIALHLDGPNGAGKTTALRMLLGLVRPTAGAALIGGRPSPSLPLADSRAGRPVPRQDYRALRERAEPISDGD